MNLRRFARYKVTPSLRGSGLSHRLHGSLQLEDHPRTSPGRPRTASRWQMSAIKRTKCWKTGSKLRELQLCNPAADDPGGCRPQGPPLGEPGSAWLVNLAFDHRSDSRPSHLMPLHSKSVTRFDPSHDHGFVSVPCTTGAQRALSLRLRPQRQTVLSRARTMQRLRISRYMVDRLRGGTEPEGGMPMGRRRQRG